MQANGADNTIPALVSINHWAKDYINILSSNGITIGSQGHFNPNDQVSRMHYATFMYRIVQ